MNFAQCVLLATAPCLVHIIVETGQVLTLAMVSDLYYMQLLLSQMLPFCVFCRPPNMYGSPVNNF